MNKMGCFSWMFADLNNAVPLNIGMSCYVLFPDGSSIHEPCYDGYGHFGGSDIYELVLSWNHADVRALLEKSAHTPLTHWSDDFLETVENDLDAAEKLAQTLFGDSEWLRTEWRRTMGIDISCYDDQNEALRYPIKIVKTIHTPYADLPASKVDINQGFGDEDPDF